MAYTLTLDPPAVATNRTALELNSGPIRVGATGGGGSGSVDYGDAAIAAYLADARWGSAPVDFRVPNRTVTVPLFLGADGSSFAAAKSSLTEKVALFQREGGWLRRGDTGWYADVVGATLTLPDKWGEAAGIEPDVKLVLECLPDFYGDEITLDAVTGTGELNAVLKASGVQARVSGDHPARCRILVSDTSGNNQDGVVWALRSRHYDPAATAALVYEAEAMTPLDAAATFVHAGASGGSTMRHNSLPGGAWCPVLETDLLAGGALTHKGSYQVRARVYSATAVPQLRLLWGVGDVAHAVTNAAVKVPGAGAFYIVSLGQVRLDAPPVGGYAWHGLIQALAANTNDPVEIDCLYLQPLDEYAGQLAAVQSGSPFSAQPNQSFITGASGPVGVAVDATYVYWTNEGANTIGRALLNGTSVNQSFITGASGPGRIAVDGTFIYWTNYNGNTIGRALLNGTSVNQSFITGASGPSGVAVDGTFIYWTNFNGATIGRALLNGTSVNQSFITGASGPVGIGVDGTFIYWTNAASNAIGRALLNGTSPSQSFITGASGPEGIAVDGTYVYWTNYNGNTIGRALLNGTSVNQSFITGANLPEGVAVDGTYLYWTNFNAATIGRRALAGPAPTPDAVLYASRTAELRTEGMFRQDSTGTVESPVASVIGDLPRLPPSGMEARAVELLVKPSRGDLATLPDAGLDTLSAQVIYRPCFITSPS